MLSAIVMGVKGSVFIAIACWLFAKLLRPEEAKWIRGTPTFLAIFIFAIGAVAHIVWIYFAILVCLIAWKAKSRAEAIALYPICLVSLPALRIYLTAGSMTLAPIDKWLVFAIGLTAAIAMRPKRAGKVTGYLDIAFLLLFAVEVIQARGSNFTSVLRDLVMPVFALLIPYYLVSRNLKSVEDIRRVVLAFTFVGFLLSCIALVEMIKHWLIYQSLYQMLNVPTPSFSLYAKVRSGLLRAPTSFPESTSFGLFLAYTMMFGLAGRDAFRKKRGWLIALGVMFLGTIAANSRNAWIGLAIGLPLFDLYRRRYGSLFAKLAVFALLYASVIAAAQVSPYVASLAGRSEDSAGTITYRQQLFDRGLEEVRKHPWTGQSLEDALDDLQDMRQGEGIVDLVNGYLAYALTAGYLGAAALLMAFVWPVLMMLARARRLAFDPRLQRYGAAVCAIAGFSIVTSFFTAFGGADMTFYLITLAMGTAILSVRRPPRVAAAEAEVSAPEILLVPA